MIGNETIGKLEPDNLVFDSKFPLDVKSVTLSPRQGVIKRGTVIGILDDGKCVVWSGDDGIQADCILSDDLDTGTEGHSRAPVVGTAYRSGHFIKQALIVAEGSELTAAAEDELRKGGIYLSSAVM